MPLDIIIVGAGIAGLSAAIALARQDHKVRIFETSSFSKEVGAAFNIAAPAVKILKSWELDLDQLQPDICHRWELYKGSPTEEKPVQVMMASSTLIINEKRC
jgi:2-polyprenyl-6-methoxyphenol hydroxylase-like FAD-dependent oxidoreductase